MTMLDISGETASLAADVDATFTWDYERSRDGLSKLYEKAKASQWNATTDLDWTIDVDPEREVHRVAAHQGVPVGAAARWLADLDGSPIASWGEKEFAEFALGAQQATLSQFLHGEQGALACTARLVETVPWIDAKYYAATQVMDEARHVEVFARYLDEKLERTFPINDNLNALVSAVLTDPRWDIVYLGMQVVIEGLALSAFGMMRQATEEPLLAELLKYVMADEARHVAFGILSLAELYDGLDGKELRERQEFCLEAVDHMRHRTINAELWESLGVDPQWVTDRIFERREQRVTQSVLFSKIVPNVKKLGLLDAGDGWLRAKFDEIGITRFEDWPGGDEEFPVMEEVA